MSNINGPLNFEVHGDPNAPSMVFIHPNPMDSSSWMYQEAHFSTWYRCVSIDLPGYGRSPSAEPGVSMMEIAEACWEAVDKATAGGRAVLVGCSVGSNLVQFMYHLRPESVEAVVVSGAGWRPVKEFATRRAHQYRENGLSGRYTHALDGFSPSFRETPMARWFAQMCIERNDTTDASTIVAMFEALGEPDPDWLQASLHTPVLIISGRHDAAHAAAFELHDRLPNAELAVIDEAGHACHIERPWEFDALMIRFLSALGHDLASAR